MATTRLSTTATPGRNYSFSPKSGSPGPHTGEFTKLSTIAVPGRKQTFAPKSPAAGHTGEFTKLSTIAVPGRKQNFVAKTAAVEVVQDTANKHIAYSPEQDRIAREDEEILSVIMSFLQCH